MDTVWIVVTCAVNFCNCRAIFLWLCSKDLTKLNFDSVQKGSPEEILMNLQQGLTTYAVVFEILCRYWRVMLYWSFSFDFFVCSLYAWITQKVHDEFFEISGRDEPCDRKRSITFSVWSGQDSQILNIFICFAGWKLCLHPAVLFVARYNVTELPVLLDVLLFSVCCKESVTHKEVNFFWIQGFLALVEIITLWLATAELAAASSINSAASLCLHLCVIKLLNMLIVL